MNFSKMNGRANCLSVELLEDRRMLATVFDHNDIAYFLDESTARVHQYNLASESWLDSIALDDASERPTAGWIDDEGIYVAFDKNVYRYDVNGTRRTHLFEARSKVNSILSDENILFIDGGVTIDKNTNSVVENWPYFSTMAHQAIAPGINRVFGTSTSSPTDLHALSYDDNGLSTNRRNSPYHGEYWMGDRTWFYPDETIVVDSKGLVFSTSSLRYAGSFGGEIDDLDFTNEEVPVVLRGNELTTHDASFLPSSSVVLDHSPSRVFVNAANVITFTPNSLTAAGFDVRVIGLDTFGQREPGPVVDPTGLAYTPDEVVVAADGSVLVFSKSQQSVFRWDPGRQVYSQSIPLIDVPDFMTYSQPSNTIYLAYPSGLIRKIDLNETELTEVPFAALSEAPAGITAAGEIVFGADRYSIWSSHHIFAPDGRRLDSTALSDASKEFVWSAANQKMYQFSATSPRDIFAFEITANFIGRVTESSLHNSDGFEYPIRVAPNGQHVVFGSGVIHDGLTMERLAVSLENSIADAAWLDGVLYTIRSSDEETQLQQWEDTTYSLSESADRDYAPLALLSSEALDRLVVVGMADDGVPVFEALDSDFKTLPPSVWTNLTSTLDVSADGIVAPIDALIVVNEINERVYTDAGSGQLFALNPTNFFPDVNADGLLSPVDALLVINHLNARPSTLRTAAFVPTVTDGGEEDEEETMDPTTQIAALDDYWRQHPS